MLLTTTSVIEGQPVREYLGVVTGETIIGANVFKDFLAGMRDFFGGRSGSYEKVLREAKDTSLREMEERGLVERRVYPEVPPRVEYSLTEAGASLRPVIDAMRTWGGDYQQRAAQTRK